MLISYVIRLRPDALDQGQFVGEIEAVATRARSSFRSVQQATAFILATSPEQVRQAGEPVDDGDLGDLRPSAGDLGDLRPPAGDGIRLRAPAGDGPALPAPMLFRDHR